MTDVQRFAFTKIVVDDLDAQCAFYASVFGLSVRHRTGGGTGEDEFDEIVLGDGADGASLLLLRFRRGKAPSPDGVVLGFTVSDVAAVVRAAVAAGGAVTMRPRPLPGLPLLVGQCTDLDGRALEVVQQL